MGNTMLVHVNAAWSKLLLIAILGFASGLPLALTGSTLQAWATEFGLNLMAIGALSLVGQAYAVKMLWAPLVDRKPLAGIKGLRRSWLVGCQLVIAIGLGAMALCRLPDHYGVLIALAIVVAVGSATFDTAFDAFRIEYLAKADYGLGNALYVTCYRIAMLVSGGLAMVMAAYYGWRLVYGLMALLALLAAGVSCWVPVNAAPVAKASGVAWRGFWPTLSGLCCAIVQAIPQFMWVLAFILLYKFGEAFGTALSTTFLLRIGHFSLVQIGFAYKTCGLLATIGGSFIGAMAYRYMKLGALLLIFGVLQALSLAWYIPIALGYTKLWLMLMAVVCEAGCAGMATTVFVTFLMRLCQQQFVATQFALLAALAAVGRIVTGPLAAWTIAHIGWASYYGVSMLMCMPALGILWILRRHPALRTSP